MSFWSELKRRNVFKVGAAYVIVAWLIVQVANTFFPLLNFPKWTVPLVAVLVILGFPLAILFAWAFELTPEGLKKTEHVPLEESITHITGKKLDYILIGVIVLAVAFILFDNLYLDKRAIETEVASRVAELATPTIEEKEDQKTIAVLPFLNLSSDPEQEYFVDGLTEELLNSLAQIPKLTVIARTSSFSFKGTTKKIQEIADELGVAHILEGSVRKAGNALRITAQLVKGADGSHLWSKTYDRELKDIFTVQEDIATAVADELKVTLGIGGSTKQLGGTDNVEAYELYLIAKGYFNTPPVDDRSLESIDKAIEFDPGFALAWALKSSIQQSLAMQKGFAVEDRNEGLDSARKAIELEPNLPDGYSSLGSIKFAMGELVEAGLAYRKALELVTDSTQRSTVINAQQLWRLGYLTKAKETVEANLLNDPLSVMNRGLIIQVLGVLGERQQAEKEYERAKSLFGEEKLEMFDWAITTARLALGDALRPEDISFGPSSDIINSDIINLPKEGLAELRKIYTENNNLSPIDLTFISDRAAYFGDPQLAMDALEKACGISSVFFFSLWAPIKHDVRQLPQFKEFVRKIGLVDYWEQFGWPDLCRPLDNGDFECD